jgi:hypothetical protein
MTLEEIEARRAERKARLEEERNAQRALDLEAIDALEVEHGDNSVAVIDVPYTQGLPTCAAVRCPKPSELKRYQARLKEQKPDTAKAAEEIGAVAQIYPPVGDDRDGLHAARPGLLVQLGVAALGLSTGKAQSEGKD